MNKTNFDYVGGFPVVLDDFMFDMAGVREALTGILSAFGITAGDSFVISGCEVVGANRNAGWVCLDGEVYHFPGQALPAPGVGESIVWAVAVTFAANGDKTLEDTTTVSTYHIRKAELISAVYNPALHLMADGTEATLEKKILAIISTVNPLKTKVIDIGDWDMDATDNISVAHGIDPTKIRTLSVIIRNDANNNFTDLNIPDVNTVSDFPQHEGIYSCSGANILLRRRVGSFFDTADHDSTGYNRGWITIQYAQ